MERGRTPETDSGWVGAGPDDDLDERLAAEDETELDLAAPHVMTALGPIEPAALGVTLCGERLTWRADEPEVAATDDRHATLAELDDAYASGVRAVLDLGDPARRIDLPSIRWLAKRAPTHLIVPTTIAPALGVDVAVDRLVADVAQGIEGTAIRAGAILLRLDGGLACRDLQIAALAAGQRQTGAPLLVSVADDWLGDAVALLMDAGVAPERIILVVSAHMNSAEALRWALAGGSFVALVDVAADGWVEAARHAGLVASWAADGFGDRLLLGSGLARRADLRAYGGEPGWSGMIERLPLLLMEAGLDAVAVRALLVDNPRRALTIEPPTAYEGTA
jgi:5-phospho-D-xylono-1,4-lactonase